MQIATQRALDLFEEAGTIGFWDIEATGLKGDYNSVLVISVKRYGHKPISFAATKAGQDKELLEEAVKELSSLDAWVTYYGKGFDFPMINTRLLQWGLPALDKKPHIDMYYALKYHLLTARKSQAHLLDWLGTPEKKMSVSAEEWNRVLRDPAKAMPTMKKRCESDCAGLEALYKRTRHLVKDVK